MKKLTEKLFVFIGSALGFVTMLSLYYLISYIVAKLFDFDVFKVLIAILLSVIILSINNLRR